MGRFVPPELFARFDFGAFVFVEGVGCVIAVIDVYLGRSPGPDTSVQCVVILRTSRCTNELFG